jgi:hypothetical protein
MKKFTPSASPFFALRVRALISISAKKLPQVNQILFVELPTKVKVLSPDTSKGRIHEIEAFIFALSIEPYPFTIPLEPDLSIFELPFIKGQNL